LYFRINSKGHWPESIALPRLPDNLYLSHDSFVECGSVLEWDDFVIEESIKETGVIGFLSDDVARAIRKRVLATRRLSGPDRAAILKALDRFQ
jgi:hypothetical protein